MDDEDQYWYCNDLKMSKVELLESKGLIGCLNDSGVTSENYKQNLPHFVPEQTKASAAIPSFPLQKYHTCLENYTLSSNIQKELRRSKYYHGR